MVSDRAGRSDEKNNARTICIRTSVLVTFSPGCTHRVAPGALPVDMVPMGTPRVASGRGWVAVHGWITAEGNNEQPESEGGLSIDSEATPLKT